MRVPSKRDRIPRIYHWRRRGQGRPNQDTSYLGLDNTQENQGNQMFPGILQLRSTIHSRVQHDGQTTIRENKKGRHQQLGMGRQRTSRVGPIKDQTPHGTSTGLLRPPRTTKILTDTSKYVCSGILSPQCQDGKWRPVAYQSKTMSDAECNNDIQDKELLFIVQACHEWTRYRRGNPKTNTGSHRA